MQVGIINVSFATVFLIQSFHSNNFLASKYPLANRHLVGFILLPLKCPINFF